MITVIEVKTKKQMRAFADFPLRLYKGSPYYVPSFYMDEVNLLSKKKNPNLEDASIRCFLAYKDGKIAGRIAGIIQHKYNALNNLKTVRFSRFDCIDDLDTAKALIGAVESYGRENGLDTCHGPWGFNDQDREGLMTFGFDKRATYATNYNYDYYADLVRGCGYTDESEWVEYKFTVPKKADERFDRIAAHVAKKFKLREIANSGSVKSIIKERGVEVLEMANAAYADLDCYVPISGRALQNVLTSFGLIINPQYLSIIVDEKDKVIGVGVALADICGALQKSGGKLLPFGFIRLLKAIKKPKGLELALIAVMPEYQKTGVNAMIISRIMGNIIKNGITNVESNPELADNTAVRSQWDSIEKQLIKRRKTFVKSI